MGRTSKFSFPIPGRKQTTATKEKDEAPAKSTSGFAGRFSKAQRILGTDNNLNIDSPTRDDDRSWRYPSSTSSGMSISISESTPSIRSTDENESVHEPNHDQWDRESGVFPRPRLHGKASSTLLGKYGGDAVTDTSSVKQRMHREDSSSTLKSYYDRQNSPLAISQQTSASSARDLALRKGQPPVVSTMPRSPLLHVESAVDPFEGRFAERIPNGADSSHDKSVRKKPAKLDLSMLFPSRKKRGTKRPDTEQPTLTAPPLSTIPTNGSYTAGSLNQTGRRKLTKTQSKESLQSQQHSVRSTRSHDPRQQRQTTDTLSNLYESYENLALSPRMSRIPESGELDRGPPSRSDSRYSEMQQTSNPARNPLERRESSSHSSQYKTQAREHLSPSNRDSFAQRSINSTQSEQRQTRDRDYISPDDREPFSWKNVRESINSPWDSSAASVSSRNTKTSRHTSTSAFSNSDLKQSSVLSLSSDSDEEASESEPVRSPISSSHDKSSRVLNGASQRPAESRHRSSQQPELSSSRKHPIRKGAAQPSPFLSIPETSTTSARLSGPWAGPNMDALQSPSNTRSSGNRDLRPKKTSSIGSKRSSSQPTPPLSPASVAFREAETRDGRFMAVTKQEEALLEALRQKRARMREEIIEEHETAKSPPRTSNRTSSRYSKASSVSTVRGPDGSNDKHRILLYLDTPLNDVPIDTAEPSPDLSDFLSFGSDEESTPRTSWQPPRRGQPRPDSSAVSPDPRTHKFSPMTPPSVARLSAVGAAGGFRGERRKDHGLIAKKRLTNAGVRFVDDGRIANAQDFLLDENESDVIWGM